MKHYIFLILFLLIPFNIGCDDNSPQTTQPEQTEVELNKVFDFTSSEERPVYDGYVSKFQFFAGCALRGLMDEKKYIENPERAANLAHDLAAAMVVKSGSPKAIISKEDYFAGQALAGITDNDDYNTEYDIEDAVELSFIIARNLDKITRW